jgi:hypothetical protein
VTKLNRKKKNEILKTLEKEKIDDSFNLLCRFKNGNQKDSIKVPKEQVRPFSQSILNIYRLNCLKSKNEGKKKKIVKPSQKNPKSKKVLKQKERVKFFKTKKEETKKSREEKLKRKDFLFKLAKGIKVTNK